jgi:hypothetical protein
MGEDEPAGKRLLIELLQQAAQLEHCLLNSYLYAAASLKSMPQEWATVSRSDEEKVENARRAVQFERSRRWKQSILSVTHEEMLHLHYVQCMLRALGAAPQFTLPVRDEDGHWRFTGWKSTTGGVVIDPDGLAIPLRGLTIENIKAFVQYESTDALQDEKTFGDRATSVYRRLQIFEQELYYASVLRFETDPDRRAAITNKLEHIYRTVPPTSPPPTRPYADIGGEALEGIHVEDITFPSIGDLYRLAIAPLFEEAFEAGWVEHDNRDLNNELQNPNFAGEGFLPIGPVYRDKNFEKAASANSDDPLRNYKGVDQIIDEIVSEGEGFRDFLGRAETFLADVERAGGTCKFLDLLMAEDRTSDDVTPPLVVLGQLVRMSHLARFAVIWAEMEEERELCSSVGVEFEPVRTAVDVTQSAVLKRLAEELPAQFNACFLVLIAWLGRIYEVQEWRTDGDERRAIEMLAAWPLMSLSIRPLLELASIVLGDAGLRRLFSTDVEDLPLLPLHARQLHGLWSSPARSAAVNEAMDYHAIRVLADVASWARQRLAALSGSEGLDETTELLAQSRLSELSQLDTFKAQFPYRSAGGYSDRQPDLTYRQAHPDAARFSENPVLPKASDRSPVPLWRDTVLLRVRFGGWGLVQLATDPDPPGDEVGCSGTLMLHPADGDRHFDKALVWQDVGHPNTILRTGLPDIGVNVREWGIVVTDGDARAGYVPAQVMSSTGAVQADGVQNVVRVSGLLPLLSVPAAELEGGEFGVDLLLKDGVRPFLNGYNHVVSQDGEAIDPFVIAIGPKVPGRAAVPAMFRGAYSNGTTFMSMTPLEQLESSRRPVGFGSLSDIPTWVRGVLGVDPTLLASPPAFAKAFLQGRAGKLLGVLTDDVAGTADDRAGIDGIVSLAERCALVSVPKETTFKWLMAVLHYGHSVSGNMEIKAEASELLSELFAGTGIEASISSEPNRMAPNARWFASYSKGVMDTDGIRDLVFGELYIPIGVVCPDSLAITEQLRFPLSMRTVIAELTTSFDRPFWSSDYTVVGPVRTCSIGGIAITERRLEQSDAGYRYEISGLPGFSDVEATLKVVTLDEPEQTTALQWALRARSNSEHMPVAVLTYVARTSAAMQRAIETYVQPRRLGVTET